MGTFAGLHEKVAKATPQIFFKNSSLETRAKLQNPQLLEVNAPRKKKPFLKGDLFITSIVKTAAALETPFPKRSKNRCASQIRDKNSNFSSLLWESHGCGVGGQKRIIPQKFLVLVDGRG